MVNIQTIFTILLGSYLIGGMLIYCNYLSYSSSRITSDEKFFSASDPTDDSTNIDPANQGNTSNLYFEDHVTAYYVLQQLDVFEPVDIKYINVSKGAKEDYTRPILGLKIDEDYCAKHRARFVTSPAFIFETQNYLLTHHTDSMIRTQVIPFVGQDVHPEISGFMLKAKYHGFVYDMRVDLTTFVTQAELYTHRNLGKQFSCITQMSNHLPGHENLYRKDFVAQALVNYAKTYQDRPHCFNYDKFFPKSWVLYQPGQCKQFFEEFNSPEYQILKQQRKIVYIRKVGAFLHKGLGVSPVDDAEEENLRTLYGNGTLCGKTKNLFVIQYFVHNPLLIHNRKFDFRIYMLIASTNPIIVFSYDGYVRVSLHLYNTQAEHRGAVLTNTFLSEDFFDFAKKNGTYEGMTEEELREYHLWNFDKLHNYVYEQGLVSDPQWLDNYLRPEIRKSMIHLIRMSQSTFLRQSTLFELFGLDMMLDEDLRLWFIEANAKPGLEGFSKTNKEFIKKMIFDHFEIMTGLLRSRTKRIINYVNTLINEGQAWKLTTDKAYIVDLEKKREEFKEITKNYFEPEFEPSSGNLFTKIIDENLEGTERYAGLIDEDCL